MMTGWGSAQRMHVSSFRLEGRRTDSWEMGFASATYILVATTSSYLYIIYILVGATSLYPHIICIYPAWCNIIVSIYCIYPGLILFSSPYIWSVTWLWFPICQNRCPCHQIYVTWIMKKLFTRFRSAWIKSGQMVPTVSYIYCYVALEDRCEKCLGLQIRSVLGRDSYKSS